MADEYKPMGVTMPNLTIGYGMLLIVWGITVSFLSDTASITSYIPTIVGIPMAVSGIMAKMQPEKKKLWIHVAIVIGALCALGGTQFFRVMSKDDVTNYAKTSMLMLFITGLVYTYLCVQSFKHARRSRTE